MSGDDAATPAPAAPIGPGARAGSPLDVAVNLLWCVPGEVGGSEQYLVRQLLGLAGLRSEFLPTLYCLPAFVDAHPELVELYPMTSAPIDGGRRSRRVVGEHTWLRRRTRSAALVHHGGGTSPMVGARPVVLTVHDLQHLTHPEYLSSGKRRYLSTVIPRSVARAATVAVPTEYVRSTVIDAYGTDPDKVLVVPHGVEPTLGSAVRSEFDLRRDFGLGAGRVLVLPAITHPHKGHRFLLGVMAEHWDDPDLRLVLLGGAGTAEGDVVATIERLGLQRRVVRPGRVSDEDRDGLVSLAEALVFPSEYEGFGAPVVEAMALGTPVVCSDQPALAEVVGDAGVVLPRKVDAWAGALDEVARRRAELRAAGRRRAEQFTTAASGAALLVAYRHAIAAGRP